MKCDYFRDKKEKCTGFQNSLRVHIYIETKLNMADEVGIFRLYMPTACLKEKSCLLFGCSAKDGSWAVVTGLVKYDEPDVSSLVSCGYSVIALWFDKTTSLYDTAADRHGANGVASSKKPLVAVRSVSEKLMTSWCCSPTAAAMNENGNRTKSLKREIVIVLFDAAQFTASVLMSDIGTYTEQGDTVSSMHDTNVSIIARSIEWHWRTYDKHRARIEMITKDLAHKESTFIARIDAFLHSIFVMFATIVVWICSRISKLR